MTMIVDVHLCILERFGGESAQVIVDLGHSMCIVENDKKSVII